MSDVHERFAPTVARERARMEQGDTLDMVLQRLRADESINTVAALVILRDIKLISFSIAKTIVSDAWQGSCPHLDLDDLALLASVPQHCKALWWLPHSIDHAIVGRQPRLRLVPGSPEPSAEPGVAIRQCRSEFVAHRDALKRAIAEEPKWAREIEIVRDDDAVFEIRFVRVR